VQSLFCFQPIFFHIFFMIKFFFPVLLICSLLPLSAQEPPKRERPRVGLVLSGGGALGFAHVGALKIIDSLGIPIDYVAGTSFGGLVGGLYSIGYRSDSLQKIVDAVDWTDLFNDQPKRNLLPFAEKKYSGRYHIRLPLKGITPTPPSGVIAGQKISLLFSRLTYNFAEVGQFDSLPIPFRCVGVDLITGNQVVIKNGPLARAMRATMAIPSAFSPVEYGDSLLSDGGLLNNYPVDVLKSMGAEIVVGVDVSGYKFSRHDARELLKVLDRASSIPRYQRLSEFIATTDIYIEPDLDGFSIADFEPGAISKILDHGYRAAQLRLDTLIGLKTYLDSFKIERDDPVRFPPKSKELFVHGVQIVGNERLDFSFIYSLLNIRPGSLFSPDIIEEKITEAYALGYFETITYATQTVTDTSASIVVTVKEKLFRELNIGLRYDEFHELVGILGVRSTNVLLTGIRFESEMEFAGLFRTWGKVSYPSRSLDLPIYPFLIVRYRDVPLHLHNLLLVTQLKERSLSIGAGFGLMIDKSLSIETELNDEGISIIQKTFSDIPKITNHLRHLSLSMAIDQVDDMFVPRSGISVNARIEYSSGDLGSDFNYTQLIFTSKYYLTAAPLHTVMIGGSYYRTVDSPPFYKNHFIGGPEQFIGADYMQINGSKFIVGRAEYRYEYKRDIFLKGMMNVLIDPDILNPVNPANTRTRFGFGIGVMFTSILGPLEIILARGDRSYVADRGSQRILHFSAGMKF
jgi:NTE family protein